MKTTKFFTTMLAAMALTACSNEETINEGATNDRVALQVTSGIQTRAIGSTWQKDDAIGIYMLKAGGTVIAENATNKRYTTDAESNAFKAEDYETIYFPVDGSDVDFIAYYPQQTLTDGSMTINVSSQTSLPKIDLMTAKVQSADSKKYNKSQPNVAFNFSHKLTKIELNIAYGTGLTAKDLEGLTVEITNQRTKASYTPLTETLTLNTDQTPQAVTFNTAENGMTAEAILLPNSEVFNPQIANRQLVFTLKNPGVDGKTEVFRWSIIDEKDFKAGERNIYNITINRTGLTVTATIEDWNPGNGLNGEGGSAE